MRAEIDRLTTITESYLRFARLPSPTPQFSDLNELAGATLEFMKGELGEHGVSLRVDLAPDLDPILADPGQVRQALSNLILNACEAMPDGGTLEIGTRRIGDETVELSVTDTGIGVPPEAAEQIFESFYTTKTGGTGLGLAMVRHICLAQGGEVRYEAPEGGGSRFVVTLPLTRPNQNTRSEPDGEQAAE
jgi:signal transduction histidine kinase